MTGILSVLYAVAILLWLAGIGPVAALAGWMVFAPLACLVLFGICAWLLSIASWVLLFLFALFSI